jgi:hypothetical protein
MPAPAVPPARRARAVTSLPRLPEGFRTEFEKKGWRHHRQKQRCPEQFGCRRFDFRCCGVELENA